jgi:hypothetical protein
MRFRFIPRRSGGSESALTLVEIVTTMGVFSLVVIALIYSHLVGLMQDQLVESKLGASETSRRGFDQIMRDIRSAKIWAVGSLSGTNFTPTPSGENQVGSALQLFLVNNDPTNITYFFTNIANDNKLCRQRTGDTTYTVIASNLVDTLSFAEESYNGLVLTTNQWRNVIHFVLNFQQYQYPLTKVGSNYLVNLYKMEFRVAPHVPD